MKNKYLVVAIIGGVLPYVFFFQFFESNGINLPSFINGLFINGAASGFTVDLLITSSVFWLFMFNEQKENNAPKPLLFIVINLFIGLSCALPLYLYFKVKNKD